MATPGETKGANRSGIRRSFCPARCRPVGECSWLADPKLGHKGILTARSTFAPATVEIYHAVLLCQRFRAGADPL
jgi:hypothetical protein